MNIFKKHRGPAVHLLLIGLALAALAAAAWWYTNSREEVAGLPVVQVPATLTDESPANVPTDPEACERAGGTWNECASACPPDAEACILMCVPRCEGLAGSKMTISAYFPNAGRGSDDDCSLVFPLEREALGDPYTGAIEALLDDVSKDEAAQGYSTSLPASVKLLSVNFRDGVVTADFSKTLNKAAGSCRVGSIRAQIERTLMQFPGVTRVVISVNGDAEMALQP